jgi:aryl-alcohol dehydrogenase-like predicted oxidoreductase
LDTALDMGLNFLDTAACYNISEELIGRTITFRRDDYFLATKCGHITGGYEGEDWTAKTVTDSIDRSLKRLQTPYLDLIQLHTCSVEILEKGEVIQVLQDAQNAGKTRFIGYSGDNEDALWAVESGIFDTLQTSFNLVDQKAKTTLFQKAKAQQMGIIVKRPIANGAWGVDQSPSGYADQYFARAQALRALGPLPNPPAHRILLALGFAFAHKEVDTFIVGTGNIAHLRANVQWIAKELPIAAETVSELHRRFDRLGQDWRQLS